jgi:hypothetical protein
MTIAIIGNHIIFQRMIPIKPQGFRHFHETGLHDCHKWIFAFDVS